MARWQLTEPHYLNVPGTKWEQTITNKATNRPERKTYKVPQYLHPDVDSDWNRFDGHEGIITVCHVGKGHSDGKDVEFEGPPTPGMLPLDEEAKAISNKFDWKPTQGLDDVSQAESHTSKILGGLIDQLTDMKVKTTEATSIQGMDKFMETMTAMMAQNQQILMLLAGKVATVEATPKAVDERTVEQIAADLGIEREVDLEEPLPSDMPPPRTDRPRSALRR